ncbi:DNA cytosine methyltransferase [Kocuria sp. CPCC 205258]|uniref:DNA cytosine methyltransferase n=1 Tax=Kocuria sp. CPCC 205258 TaxID=3073552 RepID=UPI0034D619AE
MTSVQSDRPASSFGRVVDLFAGPGGLDVAARWLGLSAVGIEWDKDACTTRRAAGLETVQGDVREYGPADFPDAAMLVGGPPCQTYTVAGTGAGRRALEQVQNFISRMAGGQDVTADLSHLDDERTGLVLQPLRWILEAHERGHPYKTVVLEQVPAVLPVWEAMAEALHGLGYKTTSGILRAEEFGVPQTRRRAILIAHQDYMPRLPQPTHRRFRKREASSDDQLSLLSWDSMLRPCETIRGTLHRPGPYVIVSNYGSGGDPKARGLRSWEEPAATVTGKVSRNRVRSPDGTDLGSLELFEAGQLQTFPEDYPWSGGDRAQQIGNAIPPRLGAHVLAAALGRNLDLAALEEVVRSSWTDTGSRPPLLTDTLGTESLPPERRSPPNSVDVQLMPQQR